MRPVKIVIPTLDSSIDGKLAAISSFHTDCQVIVSHDADHVGFTKTVNEGMRRALEASADCDICLLNDDVYRFTPGWLVILQRELYSRPDIGIVGPSGKSGSISKAGHPGMHGRKSVVMLPFWCVVIKRELIDSMGLLDESFIHYSSDTWYCRMARRRGWKVVWVRSAYLWHHHQGSGLNKEWRIKDRETLVRLGKANKINYSSKVPGL